MKKVATMSLPAVDRPNADRWNAARSRQKDYTLHMIIALVPLFSRYQYLLPKCPALNILYDKVSFPRKEVTVNVETG